MSGLLSRVAEEQARPLPPTGVAALRDELWPGGAVTAVERVVGGLGAAMHRVEALDADGRPDAVMVRAFLAAYGDGSDVAEREHATLAALAVAGAPAPAPRWLDATGAVLGRPALAMEVVPGRPIVADPVPDVGALARVLSVLHGMPVARFGHLPGPGPLAEQVRRALPTPEPRTQGFVDTARLWRAIDGWIAATEPAPPTLVHGDFHPGNVLSDGHRTTVVDWTWAGIGDPGRDLGYCRYDLTLAYGPDAAQAFTDSYLTAGGSARPSAGWDLVAVASSLPTPADWLRGFVEHGRDDCTVERFEAAGRTFLADALGRLG